MFSIFDGQEEPGVNCPSHDGARQEANRAGTHRHRGPFLAPLGGLWYVIMFVDSTSRLKRPHGIHDKSAATILAVLKRFIAEIGVTRALRRDNGAEYTNHPFVE